MAPPPLASDQRCHSLTTDDGRCSRPAYADGWCLTHHPNREQRRRFVLVRRAVEMGMHDFWMQICVAAMLAYLQKASKAHYDALVAKLC